MMTFCWYFLNFNGFPFLSNLIKSGQGNLTIEPNIYLNLQRKKDHHCTEMILLLFILTSVTSSSCDSFLQSSTKIRNTHHALSQLLSSMMELDVPPHIVVPDKDGQDDESNSSNEMSAPQDYYSKHTNPAWTYFLAKIWWKYCNEYWFEMM